MFFLIPASPSFQPGWLETQGKSALMDPGTAAAPQDAQTSQLFHRVGHQRLAEGF